MPTPNASPSRSALQALIDQWRREAADARANNEFLVDPGAERLHCASDLAALLASWPPDPPLPPDEFTQQLVAKDSRIQQLEEEIQRIRSLAVARLVAAPPRSPDETAGEKG